MAEVPLFAKIGTVDVPIKSPGDSVPGYIIVNVYGDEIPFADIRIYKNLPFSCSNCAVDDYIAIEIWKCKGKGNNPIKCPAQRESRNEKE